MQFYKEEMVIGECTRVALNDVWNRHERDFTSIVLVEGSLKNRVDMEPESKLQKRNPHLQHTVAGVRGTEYILVYSRMGLGGRRGGKPIHACRC